MFSEIKNLSLGFFSWQSYDFFGPEATEQNLNCPILLDPSDDHLLLDCNEGIGRAKVIHEMTKTIAQSDICPNWLRYNGSVKLEKLREIVEMTDKVAKSLLSEEGFVKLSDLHFFDRESINEWSQKQGKHAEYVSCPKCKNMYKKVTFSPAIALRIKMKKSFNPRACQAAFKESPKVITLQSDYNVLDLPKPENYLKAIRGAQDDSSFLSRAATISAVCVIALGMAYCVNYMFDPSFRYQAGLAQQLTNTIMMIDGVINASVQLIHLRC